MFTGNEKYNNDGDFLFVIEIVGWRYSMKKRNIVVLVVAIMVITVMICCFLARTTYVAQDIETANIKEISINAQTGEVIISEQEEIAEAMDIIDDIKVRRILPRSNMYGGTYVIKITENNGEIFKMSVRSDCIIIDDSTHSFLRNAFFYLLLKPKCLIIR